MSGDTEEFRRIHAEFRPKVFRHLARMVGEGEAEDLTQAVMLKVSDSLAAVKIRLHRARQRLRRELQAGCSFSRGPDSGLACEPRPPIRFAGMS